jgi:hypothetical protein
MNFREQAIALFKRFHLRNPRRGEVAEIACYEPETVFLIGELEAVQYRVAGEPKAFYHKFANRGRPLLFSSADGSRIFIVKGRWKFTDRGFVNR